MRVKVLGKTTEDSEKGFVFPSDWTTTDSPKNGDAIPVLTRSLPLNGPRNK